MRRLKYHSSHALSDGSSASAAYVQRMMRSSWAESCAVDIKNGKLSYFEYVGILFVFKNHNNFDFINLTEYYSVVDF